MKIKTSLLLVIACASLSSPSLYAAPKSKTARAKKVIKPQIEYCLVSYGQGVITVDWSDGTSEVGPNGQGRGLVVARLSSMTHSGWKVIGCAGDSTNLTWTLERRRLEPERY